MVRLFVRHSVENADKWLSGYLAGSQFRDANKVVADGVYRNVDDPNDLTVWHDFETAEAARAFAALPELKAIMLELGVVGEPSVWFTREYNG